jgi:hypothetical protein
MKKVILLKALVILVPFIVAIYAGYYEHKKQQEIVALYQNGTHAENNIQEVATQLPN